MLSGIKKQGIVGKDGKIEIQASELAEGTIVEVIVLTNLETDNPEAALPIRSEIQAQDTTEYLLSNDENRRHLLESIKQVEAGEDLVQFTAEAWNEKYNIHA